MKKYLHNSDEIFASPQYGWEQMQLLLEKNLPQKSERKLYPYIVAASLVSIFLLSSLVISNIGRMTSNHKNYRVDIAASTTITQSPLRTAQVQIFPSNQGLSHSINNNGVEKSRPSKGLAGKKDLVHSSWYLPALAKAEMQRLSHSRVISIPSSGELRKRNMATDSMKDLLSKLSDGNTADRASNKKAKNQHSTWGLSAGLAMNAVIGQKQYLQPYPAAELRYNISGKFFLSMGVALGSPVNTESQGTKKRVYLNDTSNNVYFYNSVKQYSRLHYADIPLMAGMQVNKKLAIRAGVQASVLLKTQTTTVVEPYDFQLRPASIQATNLAAGAAAGSQHAYKVEARKIDYRLVTGIQYSLRKTSFHLNYQYSPGSILTGNNVSDNKNQLLSLGVQIKIK